MVFVAQYGALHSTFVSLPLCLLVFYVCLSVFLRLCFVLAYPVFQVIGGFVVNREAPLTKRVIIDDFKSHFSFLFLFRFRFHICLYLNGFASHTTPSLSLSLSISVSASFYFCLSLSLSLFLYLSLSLSLSLSVNIFQPHNLFLYVNLFLCLCRSYKMHFIDTLFHRKKTKSQRQLTQIIFNFLVLIARLCNLGNQMEQLFSSIYFGSKNR